jgi:outer membrane protein OmpA-like peptidoglycan-associated protein
MEVKIKIKAVVSGVIFVFLIGAQILPADTILPAASLAMPLDEQNGTARAMAMGSAYTGVAEGSSALLWNPAGLGVMENMEIGIHHNSSPGDLVQEIAVIGIPAGTFGGLAISINYSDNGIFDIRDNSGQLLAGTNNAGEKGIKAGWGREWMPGVYAGVAINAAQKTLADRVYYAFTGDIGLLWKATPSFTFGAAYSNLGGKIENYAVASDFRAGGSYGFDFGKSNRFLLAFSGETQANGLSRLNTGIEFTGFSMPALRFGYIYNFSNQGLSGLMGITAGIGIKVQDFTLDYAFVPSGELGSSHRLSLTYSSTFKALDRNYLPASDKRVMTSETVYFDNMKSDLSQDALVLLKRNILILKENPKTEVRIAGYSSISGGEVYNMKLSEKRAYGIRNYIIREGDISPDRVFIIWFGESNSAAYESDPKNINSEAARLNRRGLFETVKQ